MLPGRLIILDHNGLTGVIVVRPMAPGCQGEASTGCQEFPYAGDGEKQPPGRQGPALSSRANTFANVTRAFSMPARASWMAWR